MRSSSSFGILALCQEAAAQPGKRVLSTIAVLYGVSLANHWPLMMLATPAFVLALACRWRDVLGRLHVLLGLALAGVLVPYAWMVWRSNQDPLVAFYGPIRSLRDVLFCVGRRGYAGVEFSPTAG